MNLVPEMPQVIPAIQQPFPGPHPAAWRLLVTLAFKAGPIVGTKSLQQLGRLLWYVVHEDLAIAFHVALCLLKRQLADVPKGFLVILWKRKGQSKGMFLSHPLGESTAVIPNVLEKEQNFESRVSPTALTCVLSG